MKKGVVRCLHNRATARGILNTQDNLQKVVDHLARVLKQNGYPANFIRNASVYAPPTQEAADTSSHDGGQEEEKGLLVVIDTLHGQNECMRTSGMFAKTINA